jgi:ankyrin repeat protein
MGNYEITELLLKKGAYVNTQNNILNTPLHYANAFNFRKIFDLLSNVFKAD